MYFPTISSLHLIWLQSLQPYNEIPFNGDQTPVFHMPSAGAGMGNKPMSVVRMAISFVQEISTFFLLWINSDLRKHILTTSEQERTLIERVHWQKQANVLKAIKQDRHSLA